MHAQLLCCVWLFATPWPIAHQAPLSMGFSRQEYWSGLPFPSPGDLHNPGIKSTSPASPALTGRFFTTEPPGKPKAYESSLNHWTTREFPRLNVVVFFNGLSICIYKRLTLLFFFIGTDLFIFLLFFSFISWRLITLQYCRGFCRTWTWISHGFTCVPHPERPSHLPPQGDSL